MEKRYNYIAIMATFGFMFSTLVALVLMANGFFRQPSNIYPSVEISTCVDRMNSTLNFNSMTVNNIESNSLCADSTSSLCMTYNICSTSLIP